jgi:hypothetical protein
MTNKPRLIPDWPFPPYLFIPGKNPHPKKSGGHMEGQPDPHADTLDVNTPLKNRTYLYAIDLYNHDYFWESHVYFEALWNAHGRQGSVADFLKGLIKLGAAGVKVQIGQAKHAQEHFERALELFEAVEKAEGNKFLGFDLHDLKIKTRDAISEGLTSFVLSPK